MYICLCKFAMRNSNKILLLLFYFFFLFFFHLLSTLEPKTTQNIVFNLPLKCWISENLLVTVA